jgi:hypothetical protein
MSVAWVTLFFSVHCLTRTAGQMQFDLVLTNPPFQDREKRKKTPHKLWIDFTLTMFANLLKEGGHLVQVSPASFASPSNKVLQLMKANTTRIVRFGTEHHFPNVGSSFSDYWIQKMSQANRKPVKTKFVIDGRNLSERLDAQVLYLPNVLSENSLSIHRKVMFETFEKLNVEWDYVGAHNIRRYDDSPSLVEEESPHHKFPVFHTNRQIWWSSSRQDWASSNKVMWTRSGYTKPFFDPGTMGGTDMVYFVRTNTMSQGENLAHNLNSTLFRYIFKTAKWSGFGNELVFRNLPALPVDLKLNDADIYSLFRLTRDEVKEIEREMGVN